MVWELFKYRRGGHVHVNLDNVDYVDECGSEAPDRFFYDCYFRGREDPVTLVGGPFFSHPSTIIPANPGFVWLAILAPDDEVAGQEHIIRSSIIGWRVGEPGAPPSPIRTDEWGDADDDGAVLDPVSDRVITYRAEFNSIADWLKERNDRLTKKEAAE